MEIYFRGLIIICAVFVSSGCSYYNKQTEFKSVETNFVRPNSKFGLLAHYAKLADISYLDVSDALSKYKNNNYKSTFYSYNKLLGDYPELFILSSDSKNIFVILRGSNSTLDWIQNIKYETYSDTKTDGYFYIPKGHAGFRRGVIDLIRSNFLENGLVSHADQNTMEEKINITLIGHSQGGGLAQMLAPFFDGYKYKNKEPIRANNWRFNVKEIITFGSPMSVHADDWKFMHEKFGERTTQIIRDGDLISNAYLPKDGKLITRFFGKFLRITRDGQIIEENTRWGSRDNNSNTPHAIKSYQDILFKEDSKNSQK